MDKIDKNKDMAINEEKESEIRIDESMCKKKYNSVKGSHRKYCEMTRKPF